MSVIYQEIKRVALKNRMLMLIIFVLAVKFVFHMWLQSPGYLVDLNIEDNRTAYFQVMDEFGGEFSYEKQEYFTEIYDRCDAALTENAEAGLMEYEGVITFDEMWQIQRNNTQNALLLNGLDLITDQVEYVKEDSARRYLIYENGWNSFFGNMTMDYFILFWILVCVPMIFGNDYDTGMYRINRTTVNGDGRIYFARVLMGIVLSVIIATFGIIENLAVMHIRYGLYNWRYPLQSLSIFKDIPWNCTIGDAVIMCWIISLTGTVFFSVVIMLASILFKKNLYAIIAAVSLCLIPAFMFKEDILYNLAVIPASYIDRQGYLFGYTDINGNEVIYRISDIFISVCVSFFVMAIYVFAGYMVYCGKSITAFIRNCILNKKSACIMLCLMHLILCSCGTGRKDTSVTVYSIDMPLLYNYKGKIINVGISPCQIIRDGETEDLFVDPFKAMNDKNAIIFLNLDGEKLYFLESVDTAEKKLCCVNMNTCEVDEVYYHYTDEVKGYNYLSIHKDREQHEINKSVNDVQSGWVDGEYYYYLRRDSIIQCNLKTKKEKVIIDSIYNEIGYSDGYILYVDKRDYNMWLYDIEKDSRHMVSEDSCMHILGMKDGFCVQNGKQQLLFIESGTSDVTILQEKIKGHICTIDDKYIYCTDENMIFRYNYTENNQTEEVLECTDTVQGVIAEQPDGNIYVNVSDGEELKMCVFDDSLWKPNN